MSGSGNDPADPANRANRENTVRFTSTPTLDPATTPAIDATQPPPSQEEPPPPQIGPYRLLETIGEGGFGSVWVAEQTSPVRRRVALKIIKRGMDSKAVIARFEQERQALAIMDHPNIAKVLDAGTAPDGRPYFVMEYVAGEAITTYCDRNRLAVRDRLELYISICEAVQHAHHKGIIHRDIKPSNVLVSIASGSARVKVIDFGVAKAVSHTLTDKTLFTEHGQILGTPEYMSPEQAEMGALDIDTRTDVYSLGVLLYELLTGLLPFEPHDLRSKGYNEIQRIIREVDPPRPSHRLRSIGAVSAQLAMKRHARIEELEGQLRRELEWIPLKAMRKDRRERYATPLALAEDIRNHLAGRPLVAGPESALYRARKFVSRNRLPVAAAAAVALALTVGAVVSTIGFVRAARNAQAYQREFHRAEGEAKRANEEADRLRQVNMFTASLLANANPERGERKDVTVLELLEDAVLQLDGGALRGQERIDAAVRGTLGQTFRSLSLWRPAEIQWRKALELEKAAGRGNSVEAAVALTGLGQVQIDMQRLDEARHSLDEALKIHRAASNDDDPRIADTISNLGLLARARGDQRSAREHFRDALIIYERNPLDWARHADVMTNFAATSYDLGEIPEALKLTQRALELRRRRGGERSVDVWNSLINLASLREATDDLAGAEQTRREALALARELYDEKHRNVILSMNALARSLWLRGGASLEEAEKLQLRGLELAEAVDGARSLTVAELNNLLGCIVRDRGDSARAIELLRKSLALRMTLQGEDHRDVAVPLTNLADVLAQAGQAPEAIELAERALAIRRKTLPANDWTIWVTTSVLGAARGAAGDFQQAETLLLEGYKGLESSSSVRRWPRRDAAVRLVRLYERWNKPDEAQRWRQKESEQSIPSTQPKG